MKIKICGLKREEDVRYVNEAGPDAIGFVFATGRKRTVDGEMAAELKKLLAPGITAVGVFVDQPAVMVAELANRGIIDVIQLHGSEDEGYLERLRKLTGAPIWQAFVIRGNEDAQKVNASTADMLLLDSGQGSGKRLDTGFLGQVSREYFLAGGLDPDNAGELLKNPPPGMIGLDVSSGVETDGVKDREKIVRMVNAVKGERP